MGLKMLQDAAPVIASFVLKLPFGKPIPADVSSLLDHLCELLLAPFQDTTLQIFFSPSLSIIQGTPVYVADQVNSSQTTDDTDFCRKYSFSHPSLTPGICTVFRTPTILLIGFTGVVMLDALVAILWTSTQLQIYM